ncbi:MAG: histidinol-phosphate transaminase [Acutalibacteraceae bacterium]
MSRYMDKKFSSLCAYTPGEQPRDRKYIKLNTNESPYPPSPSVLATINQSEVENLCLYSDPTSKGLKQALSEVYDISADKIFVSNGSDEILNFAFMLYGGVSGAVFPDITYGFYSVFCDLYGIDAKIMPLKEDFTIDPADYQNTGRFTVIANPNAPTGMTLDNGFLEDIIKSNPDNMVLIDEAYIDFGGQSCYQLVNQYPNLIVCQTFSKSRSLAGARLGFCFASPEIIEDLEKIKYSTNPYNINRLSQAAGIAALGQNDYYTANCQKIAETRESTVSRLSALGFRILPSKANFIFAEHEDIDGGEFYQQLRKRGILVRHFTGERIKNFNRITIGSSEEMDALVQQAENILKGVGK